MSLFSNLERGGRLLHFVYQTFRRRPAMNGVNGTYAQLKSPLDLRPPKKAFTHLKAENLFKTKCAEVVRLILPRGKAIPPHRAPGELLVQCIEGRIAFTAMGETCELTPGRLLHLPRDRHHALRSLEDSTLLLIILTSPRDNVYSDPVQEGSEGSFPASDPPAWMGAR